MSDSETDSTGSKTRVKGGRSFRQRLEESVLVVAVGIAVATAGATATVYEKFRIPTLEAKIEAKKDAKHNADIARERNTVKELEAQLKSAEETIKRVAGKINVTIETADTVEPENIVLDDIVMRSSHDEVKIPTYAKQLKGGRLYALPGNEQLSLEVVQMSELFNRITGKDAPRPPDSAAPKNNLGGGGDVFLWSDRDTARQTDHPYYRNMFAHVVIRILPATLNVTGDRRYDPDEIDEMLARIKNLQRMGANSGNATAHNTLDQIEKMIQSMREKKYDQLAGKISDKFFEGDVLGYHFIRMAAVNLDFSNQWGIPFELTRILKTDDVAYVEQVRKFRGITVSGKLYSHYFVHGMWAVIRGRNDIYFVVAEIPSSERILRKSDEWVQMLVWWRSLKIKAY